MRKRNSYKYGVGAVALAAGVHRNTVSRAVKAGEIVLSDLVSVAAFIERKKGNR